MGRWAPCPGFHRRASAGRGIRVDSISPMSNDIFCSWKWYAQVSQLSTTGMGPGRR